MGRALVWQQCCLGLQNHSSQLEWHPWSVLRAFPWIKRGQEFPPACTDLVVPRAECGPSFRALINLIHCNLLFGVIGPIGFHLFQMKSEPGHIFCFPWLVINSKPSQLYSFTPRKRGASGCPLSEVFILLLVCSGWASWAGSSIWKPLFTSSLLAGIFFILTYSRHWGHWSISGFHFNLTRCLLALGVYSFILGRSSSKDLLKDCTLSLFI